MVFHGLWRLLVSPNHLGSSCQPLRTHSGVKRPLSTWLCSLLVSLGFPLSDGTGIGVLQHGFLPLILEGHICGDGCRESH
ncbi:hypothetical protein Bca4012_036407 [Brassica carinata]